MVKRQRSPALSAVVGRQPEAQAKIPPLGGLSAIALKIAVREKRTSQKNGRTEVDKPRAKA